MLLSYRSLDILAQWNIVYLDQIHKGLLLSNTSYLPKYYITYSNGKTFYRKFILYIVSIGTIFFYYSNDWHKDVFFIDIKPLKKLLLIIFYEFLSYLHSFVDVLVHILSKDYQITNYSDHFSLISINPLLLGKDDKFKSGKLVQEREYRENRWCWIIII